MIWPRYYKKMYTLHKCIIFLKKPLDDDHNLKRYL